VPLLDPVNDMSKVALHLKKHTIRSIDILGEIVPRDIEVSSHAHAMLSHTLSHPTLEPTSDVAAFFNKCIRMSKAQESPLWALLESFFICGRSVDRFSDEQRKQLRFQAFDPFTGAMSTMPSLIRGGYTLSLYPVERY